MTVRATVPGDAQVRWTSVLGAGLEARQWLRARLLDDEAWWRANTARIQVRQLRGLLRRARQTEFGREHGFSRLLREGDDRLVQAYRRAVPIRDWHGFSDRIARMREGGEHSVLWPGLVRDFAQTSGTTAGDKYIPVSESMFRSNYRASLDIFAHLMRRGVELSRLLGGKSLFLGGSSDVAENEVGVRTGDLSGLVTPLIRWPLTEAYLPGREIALMDHWPSKIDAMAARCLDEDVRMVSGMASWSLVLFERVLELARERGLDVSCVREVWPNLELFVHGGVRYDPFMPRVNEVVFGDAGIDFAQRLELYPASEGFVAMQDRPGQRGLRLMADIGLFFEFVPIENAHQQDPPSFSCWEVDKGQRYVVVLSTCAGLWRYQLGDVVEFDTVCGGLGATGGEGPARLRIVGRHRHFINAFGENLIVEHIETAVSEAAERCGVRIGEFTAAPVYPGQGTRAGLELAVEIERIESDGRDAGEMFERFGQAFDASLQRQNVDYTTKRTEGLGMVSPTITPLEPGAFHAWLESLGKLGGQHKCPRCANDREIIEGVVGSGRPFIADAPVGRHRDGSPSPVGGAR